jgi:hypothetical protein
MGGRGLSVLPLDPSAALADLKILSHLHFGQDLVLYRQSKRAHECLMSLRGLGAMEQYVFGMGQ